MVIQPVFLKILFLQSSHKKRRRSDFIPYRDSVLTWLLKENLGKEWNFSIVFRVSVVYKKATIISVQQVATQRQP